MLLLGALLACHAPGTRPFYSPLRGATIDTLGVAPDQLIIRANQAVLTRGLEIGSLSPEEGYLETRWYHLRSQRSVSTPSNSEDYVKIRFWTDPVDRRRSIIVGEAVRVRTLDPSVPPRDREELVPRGHPGEGILIDLMRSIDS